MSLCAVAWNMYQTEHKIKQTDISIQT